MYQLGKYAISGDTLHKLYIDLCDMFDHEVVVMSVEFNIRNTIPYSGDFGKYLGELFIEEQGFILTNRFNNGKLKVSYEDVVKYIKDNKLYDKNNEVKEGLIGLWK